MATIRGLYNVTWQLANHLEQPLPVAEQAREDYLDIIDFLLEKRALMISASKKKPATKPTRAEALKIMAINKKIEANIKEVKAQIGRDLRQTRTRLHMEDQYTNVYAQPAVEGFYFDKRN